MMLKLNKRFFKDYFLKNLFCVYKKIFSVLFCLIFMLAVPIVFTIITIMLNRFSFVIYFTFAINYILILIIYMISYDDFKNKKCKNENKKK